MLEEGSGRRRFTRATVIATALRLVAACSVTCYVVSDAASVLEGRSIMLISGIYRSWSRSQAWILQLSIPWLEIRRSLRPPL
jgi:hypothetical protein